MNTSRPWAELNERHALGRGEASFRAVSRALLGGDLHRAAGVRVRGLSGAGFGEDEGAEQAVVLRSTLFPVAAPVAVLDALEEARGATLRYAALPGHPEEGEECFRVDWDAEDRVWLTMTAVSRPARWYSRLGAPLARAVQRRITRAYIQSARQIADAAS